MTERKDPNIHQIFQIKLSPVTMAAAAAALSVSLSSLRPYLVSRVHLPNIAAQDIGIYITLGFPGVLFSDMNSSSKLPIVMVTFQASSHNYSTKGSQ